MIRYLIICVGNLITIYHRQQNIDRRMGQNSVICHKNQSLKPQLLKKMNSNHAYPFTVTWAIMQETYKVKEWKCHDICYHESSLDPFRSIINIKFSKLKSIQFTMNGLITIEALARLQAPLLEQLSIFNNKITSIQPLRKLQSKNIKDINFTSNLLKQGNVIVDGNWHQLRTIAFQCSADKFLIPSLEFVLKLRFNKHEYHSTTIESNHRIYEEELMKQLRNKWGTMAVYKPSQYRKDRQNNYWYVNDRFIYNI